MGKSLFTLMTVVFVVFSLTACSEWSAITEEINNVLGLTAETEDDVGDAADINRTESPSIADESGAYGSGTVSGNLCNLREGPGTEHPVVGTVKNGERLSIYGRSEDGQWLLIDPGQSVWISVLLVDLALAVDSIPVMRPDMLKEPDATVSSEADESELPEVVDVESALTCDEIFQQHKDLTDFQWGAYVESITGSPMDFLGKVEEVKSDGSIEMRACSGLFKHVTFTVYGVSKETGLAISRNTEVIGEGMIMQVYRKNTPQKGLFGTRLQEWLYIDVEGSLEPVE